MNSVINTHTHTHTHTQQRHTDRQTDSMTCMGSCGATRGASTPQRSVVSLLLSLGWLGMLTDRLRDRLALAPPCAHGCLGLLARQHCMHRLALRSVSGPLACLLLLACLLMLAYGLTVALSLALWAHCPLELAIALYGAAMGSFGHPGNTVRTHERLHCLQWPQKLIEAVLKRFEQSDDQICQLGKENGYRRVSGGLLRINGQEHGESIQPTPPLRYAALDRAIV